MVKFWQTPKLSYLLWELILLKKSLISIGLWNWKGSPEIEEEPYRMINRRCIRQRDFLSSSLKKLIFLGFCAKKANEALKFESSQKVSFGGEFSPIRVVRRNTYIAYRLSSCPGSKYVFMRDVRCRVIFPIISRCTSPEYMLKFQMLCHFWLHTRALWRILRYFRFKQL